MRKLQDTHPIRHALIWITLYVAAVNIGDAVGEAVQLPELTSILLAALSIALIVYLRAGRRPSYYGVRSVTPEARPFAWYSLPLLAIAFVQYAKGLVPGLDVTAVAFAVLLVTSVGFIEELPFRGFLLQALRTRGTVTRAVVISGVTFGFGHIVNLLRGYSVADQAIQLVAAVLIGIALAYFVVITGSILPGVAFHALFNLSGTLTNHSVLWDSIALVAIALTMSAYILVLRHRLPDAAPAVEPASATTSVPGA